jgi:Ca2+-transporting ATPase
MEMDTLKGLTQSEALLRLGQYGPNALPMAQRRGLAQILLETMREPMFLLLLVAAVLYMVLGDFREGAFLLAGAGAAIGLVIFQEARSERALAALRDLAEPHARVYRDGVEQRVAVRDIVPGDLILIGEGERVPADGLLVGGDVLTVDESTLTGESAPVIKRRAEKGETFDANPGAASSPYVFSATLSVRGQGIVRVFRTGARSTLGRIGASLAGIKHEPTPLQKSAGRIVAVLGLFAIAFCGVVALAYGVLRGDWIGGALAGITVAIALIPEEFPMVLTVFLALGAWRLAAHRVLVRRSAVIEALGGATVLCVDKTGTLTENHMRVARLWTERGDVAVSDGAHLSGDALELLEHAARASALHAIDPMDKAIRVMISRGAAGDNVLERAWPLRAEMMAVIQVWRTAGEARITAAKGAPEAIFKLCRLPQSKINALTLLLHRLADEGLRVLGVASCHSAGPFPDPPEQATFTFSGFIGFLDPLRADAPAAIAEARTAGIKVIMITGDHPATAKAIARAAGIDVAAGVMLGAEASLLSPSDLQDRLRHVRVFARIAPEQKLAIVEALKANGDVVAMTGDGVNDAPALEAAHIGIAMGKRGTDVAREAADLVLLDDSFASIVGGVRLGRRIFANLRRALTYITAIHVPIAGLALFPILFGFPPLLFPMHVVVLELAIDPTCALVFEGEPSERAAMRRPPRRPGESLFGPRQIVVAFAQGLVVLVGVLGLYASLLQSMAESAARGAAFITLVLANLFLALSDTMSGDGRLWGPHRRVFLIITAALIGLLTIVFAAPGFAGVFRVSAPSPAALLGAISIAAICGFWFRVAASVRAFAGERLGPDRSPTIP